MILSIEWVTLCRVFVILSSTRRSLSTSARQLVPFACGVLLSETADVHEVVEMYWIYVNYAHGRVRIHRGTCQWCNNGQGIHGMGPSGSITGSWIGPLVSLADARSEAQHGRFVSDGAVYEDVGECAFCLGRP